MTPGEKALFEARMRRELEGIESKAMRAEGLSPTRRRKRSKYTPLLGIMLVMALSIALMHLGMRLILKVAP